VQVIKTVLQLQEGIDQQTLSAVVFKTFEKIRARETDPEICMLILQIYEKASTVLGADEIGLKILPSIIPMMISGNLSRSQFQDLMRSVRKLLDQIETHRLANLPIEHDSPAVNDNTGKAMPSATFGGDNLDFLSDNPAPSQKPKADIFSQPAPKTQPDFSAKAQTDPFATVKPTPMNSDPFATSDLFSSLPAKSGSQGVDQMFVPPKLQQPVATP
jgi:hypothetical protein